MASGCCIEHSLVNKFLHEKLYVGMKIPFLFTKFLIYRPFQSPRRPHTKSSWIHLSVFWILTMSQNLGNEWDRWFPSRGKP